MNPTSICTLNAVCQYKGLIFNRIAKKFFLDLDSLRTLNAVCQYKGLIFNRIAMKFFSESGQSPYIKCCLSI